MAHHPEQELEYRVAGKSYSLASMLAANAEDVECCAWLRTAKPGDVYEPMHAERVVAVAAAPKKPYVVVANAGCADEFIVSEHGSYSEACAFNSDLDTDVMKRGADGALTTEF